MLNVVIKCYISATQIQGKLIVTDINIIFEGGGKDQSNKAKNETNLLATY